MPHRIGLEHEPLFLSLKTAIYWANGMSFISIVFKPGSTYNVISPVHVFSGSITLPVKFDLPPLYISLCKSE